MKKFLLAVVVMVLSLPILSVRAEAVTYPETVYNPALSRWEFDLANVEGFKGTENLFFYEMGYWKQDPVNKQIVFNDVDFRPGVGGYNSVSFVYQPDFSTSYYTFFLYVKPVKVNFVDEETGNPVADSFYLAGNSGVAYTTEGKTIPGYSLERVAGNPTGQFQVVSGPNYGTKGNPMSDVVTYYYKKAVESTVVANYQDEQGNQIADSVTHTGVVGTNYATEQKTVAGYTLKEVQGATTGLFTENSQTVTYIYSKDPVAAAPVTVKYVNEQGGALSAPVELTGNLGEDYQSEQKTFTGYTFKEVQGASTGPFTENPQTITYVYTRIPDTRGAVTVNYVDEQGKKLRDTLLLNGAVGTAYTTEQKAIAGYSFKEVTGAATGKFTASPQTVTYVYRQNPEVKATVTVNYLDSQGNVLTKALTLTGAVGTTYKAESKDFAGYTLKEVQGKATGMFTQEAQTVTYVYVKNSKKPVDNGGKTIPSSQEPKSNKPENKPVKQHQKLSVKKELPKTGEETATTLLWIGVALIGVVGLFYGWKKQLN